MRRSKNSKEPLKDRIKDGKAWEWVKKNFPDALEFVGDVTGIELLENIGKHLQGKDDISPEQYQEFVRLKELDYKELELILSDKDSARQREVGVVTALGRLDPMQLITGITGLVLLVLLVVWAFVGVEESSQKIYFHLLGVVEGVALTIFAYYFGSSKGSKDKQDILKNTL